MDDPEGYSPELQSELRNVEDKLDLWLVSGAERFGRDPEVKQALLTLARHEHSRECLLLLESILETPGLMPRLMEVLRKQGSGMSHPSEQKSLVGGPVKDQGSENAGAADRISQSPNGRGRRGNLQSRKKAR